MDPQELFTGNLALIDRVIAGVCRRARLSREDAEDFASTVKLSLMENDYAILRKYEGRSALATFLTIVVQRLLSNDRARAYGRWHPSAEAVRLGAAATLLEQVVRRDGRTLEEALPIVRDAHPELTREEAQELLKRLPLRNVRPRRTDIDVVALQPVAAQRSDDVALQSDAQRLADRTAEVIRSALGEMTLEDRMIIRLRFGSAMNVSDISRMLRLPQRPLYRRVDAIMERLRRALEAAEIDAAALDGVIGHACIELNFGLNEGKSVEVRQSNEMERPALAAERT